MDSMPREPAELEVPAAADLAAAMWLEARSSSTLVFALAIAAICWRYAPTHYLEARRPSHQYSGRETRPCHGLAAEAAEAAAC